MVATPVMPAGAEEKIPVRNGNTCTSVPLIDVCRENALLGPSVQVAIQEVFSSGRFIHGEPCRQFEEAFARTIGVRHAIGCASGSDALLLACMAIGIGPGDEVLVPSFTFFATASAVSRLGATPVFVDIDEDTFLIDPLAVEQQITSRTKAVIPVHLFGQSADLAPLTEVARQHSLVLIEDCAQATGATYHGQTVGSIGAIGCFSFYPTKNLGGFGDGGLMTTNDDRWAETLRRLRAHGMEPRYLHHEIGINSRLDTLQAACLLQKLPYLSDWNERRQAFAQRYHDRFCSLGLDEHFVLPVSRQDRESVWNQYTIRVRNGQRDRLRQFLHDHQIGTEIYYPLPLHLQPCFTHLGYSPGMLPVTEKVATEVLSLPIFPLLTDDEQDRVVDRISQFYCR